MTTSGRASLALLPIRFFFGATFLWAGLDKLLDPTFLDPSAPTSLVAQLTAFSRISPLGGLIEATLPFAPVIGLLIAIGEIGVGIGALTGLAFRVAAFGGAALSLLFWLSVSWGTHPYYLGPDLPYAIGWIALLIGGPGDRLVPARWREGADAARQAYGSRRSAFRSAGAASPQRRLLLQTGVLAAVAAVVASFAPELRALGIITGAPARDTPEPAPSPTPSPTPLPTAGSTPGPSADAPPPSATQAPATIPPDAVPVADLATVRSRGSASFIVPFDAPAPLPAGDPGVIVQLADGSLVAFDAVCTHAGCTVEWDRRDKVLFCPCHDAIFDAAHGAAVLDGPAASPLAALPIVIDVASGKVLLDPSA